MRGTYAIWTNGKTWFAAKNDPTKERKPGFVIATTCDEWSTAQAMAALKTTDFRAFAKAEAIIRTEGERFDYNVALARSLAGV